MIEQKLFQIQNIEKTNLTKENINSQNTICDKDGDDQPIHLTEDNYKIIFENSAAAITVTDQNENLVLWNQLASDLLSMKNNELYNKPISQIYPEEEWKRIRSEHIRKKGIQHHMETKILDRTGRTIDIDLSISVLKGTDGNVKGSIGIMRDISERKKVERALKESRDLSRGMIETAATAIFLIKDERFTFANRILEEMTGYSAKELKELKRSDLIFPEYLEKAQFNIQNLTTGRSTEPQIFRVLRKDLETIWVSEKLTSIVYSDKEQIMGNWMDITDWKIAESIASEHSNQTEILLEVGNTVSRSLNRQEIAESVLDILTRKLHRGPIAFFSTLVRTETFTLLAQRGFSEDFIKIMNAPIFGKGLIGQTALSGKSLVLSPNSDDQRFDFKVLQKYGLGAFCSIPVFARDKINGVICLGSYDQHCSLNKQTQLIELVANQIGVAIDNASLYERISEIAFIDGITGLYNRRFFEEGLKRELSRTLRNRQPFSIISFDLDNLKMANDNFGHQTGDQLIKEFGSILLKQTRKADIAARVGGDEFMVLVAECDHYSAKLIAERIWSQANSTNIEVDGENIKMSVSGGISGYPLHGNTIEILLQKADEALYRAKRAGKNLVFMAIP
jgi:diguanylate cyclase (GGDEF)-like protein/PAS domain S-box-containing protein